MFGPLKISLLGSLLATALLLVSSPARAQDGGKKDALIASACGAVTIKGCCQGERLRYCAAGKLAERDCTGKPKCGWNAQKNFYDCGSSGAADPTGKHSQSCPTPVDAAVDVARPDVAVKADSAVTDAGDGGARDAATPKDAAPLPDAKGIADLVAADLATDAKKRRQNKFTDGSGSCGCNTGSGDALGVGALILILALAGRRRRRLLSDR